MSHADSGPQRPEPKNGQSWNDWVRNEIETEVQKRLDLLQKPWYKKWEFWLQLVPACAVALSIPFYWVDHVANKVVTREITPISEKLSTVNVDITKLRSELEPLKSEIKEIRSSIIAEFFKRVREEPQLPRKLERDSKPLPLVLAKSIGIKGTSMLREDLRTAVSSIEYSAYSLSTYAKELPGPGWIGLPESGMIFPIRMSEEFRRRGAKDGFNLSRGLAAPGQQAEIRPLNWPPRRSTFAEIKQVNGLQLLDGFSLRNVTYEGTLIIYRGGKFKLENVRFINCLFEVHAPEEKVPLFSESMLAQLPGPVSTAD